MNTTNYVSIKTILYDISRYPFVENIQAEDIALYLTNLLSLVGSPFLFERKYININIENNKGLLPCDLVSIEGTRYKVNDVDAYIALRYASDIFHSQYHESTSPDLCTDSDATYSINNGVIYTSFKEGILEMAYKGIIVDDEGLPMIPDNPSFKQALKYYILWQYSEPARYRNEVTRDVYEDIKQQYFWYVGQASNSFNMLTPDRAKTLENGIVRLFQNVDFHSTNWKSFGIKEQFRK